MTNDDSNDPQQQPAAKKRRKRARNVDLQGLRKKLLSTCDDYLAQTPLDSLNAAMIKAIGEVVTSVGTEYTKNERAAVPSKALADFVMPFAVPGAEQPTGVLPLPAAATPANGFPSVAEPTVRGTGGGIKAAPRCGQQLHDYSGLSPRE